jgi:aspartate/tyrosine/aromatic aminotransferase
MPVSTEKESELFTSLAPARTPLIRSFPKLSKIKIYRRIIARKMYSNPPMHGALIVAKILNNKENFAAWQKELKDDVANRIIKMRKLLRAELERIGAPGTWDHITNQIGMFSFTGLSTKQCEILIDKYHIYLLKSGRISMAGINEKNYKYLAESIKSAIEQAK